MMSIIDLTSHRPIPVGYDVHVYDIENGGRGLILVLLNGQIVAEHSEATFGAAKSSARDMADQHRCAMIEHLPYKNRSYA